MAAAAIGVATFVGVEGLDPASAGQAHLHRVRVWVVHPSVVVWYLALPPPITLARSTCWVGPGTAQNRPGHPFHSVLLGLISAITLWLISRTSLWLELGL